MTLLEEMKAALEDYQTAYDEDYSYLLIGNSNMHRGICHYANKKGYHLLQSKVSKFFSTSYMDVTPQRAYIWGDINVTDYLLPRINWLKEQIQILENEKTPVGYVNADHGDTCMRDNFL
jgi:hypothetical protein